MSLEPITNTSTGSDGPSEGLETYSSKVGDSSRGGARSRSDGRPRSVSDAEVPIDGASDRCVVDASTRLVADQ